MSWPRFWRAPELLHGTWWACCTPGGPTCGRPDSLLREPRLRNSPPGAALVTVAESEGAPGGRPFDERTCRWPRPLLRGNLRVDGVEVDALRAPVQPGHDV